jgi:hypothetical protein
MKAFVIWLLLVAALFGLAAGVYHLMRSGDPERVFVVVDSSFPMEEDWDEVAPVLDELDDDRYGEFALATEKNAVHSWEDELVLAGVSAYAPRDLTKLAKPDAYPEMAEADRLVLVTNAPPAETEQLTDWEIIQVGS